MGIYRSLAVALFFFECLRLLALVVFLLLTPPEGLAGVLSVYLSSNALFPLIALFVWLKPEENRNYLALYMAGKVIALVSFYAWLIFSARQFTGLGNTAWSAFILGGCFFLCLADILSIWGAWMIKNRFRPAEPLAASGGEEEGGS